MMNVTGYMSSVFITNLSSHFYILKKDTFALLRFVTLFFLWMCDKYDKYTPFCQPCKKNNKDDDEFT